MSAVDSSLRTSAARLHRVDDAVVSLLCLLLPTGFRARQRGEWTGDLMSMTPGNPAARWRYLIGAARTLPSLRSSISRHDAPPIEVPGGVQETVARILLLGMTWPILSWLAWVPARYLAFDIPGRLERNGHTIPIDPQSVWPLEGTPGWLLPLWIVPHFGAWAVVIGGPFLLAAVGVIGTVTAALRHRRQRVHRLTVAVAALAAVLVTIAWTAATAGLSTHDDGYTAGMLGVAAAVLGAITSKLRNRTRAALLILGFSAIAVFLSFHTARDRHARLVPGLTEMMLVSTSRRGLTQGLTDPRNPGLHPAPRPATPDNTRLVGLQVDRRWAADRPVPGARCSRSTGPAGRRHLSGSGIPRGRPAGVVPQRYRRGTCCAGGVFLPSARQRPTRPYGLPVAHYRDVR